MSKKDGCASPMKFRHQVEVLTHSETVNATSKTSITKAYGSSGRIVFQKKQRAKNRTRKPTLAKSSHPGTNLSAVLQMISGRSETIRIDNQAEKIKTRLRLSIDSGNNLLFPARGALQLSIFQQTFLSLYNETSWRRNKNSASVLEPGQRALPIARTICSVLPETVSQIIKIFTVNHSPFLLLRCM